MVKKLCCLACFICIVFNISLSYAETDIIFLGIPWLADEESTLNTIKESGYLQEEYKITFSNADTVYLITDGMDYYQPMMKQSFSDVCFSISLEGYTRGRIAGHPVKNFVFTFAYDGSAKLLSVKVELINASYHELFEKLSKRYGSSQDIITEDGITQNIWKGDNNSGIVLYTESDGNDYTLVYGYLNAEEVLTKCLESDPSDLAGL